MSGTNDFVIAHGVLTKYTGSGGDAVIPEGVTTIGDGAFFGCDGLPSDLAPTASALPANEPGLLHGV